MNQFNEACWRRLMKGRNLIIRGDAPRQDLDLFQSRAPDWAKPMFTAVPDDGCDYALILQDAGPFHFPRRDTAPRMLVIGDDFGVGGSQGPSGFHVGSIRSFLADCAMVVAVFGAPDSTVYAKAAFVAARKRRDVMLIETRPAHAGNWLNLLEKEASGIEVVISVSIDTRVR